MNNKTLHKYPPIILASQSPRRKALLSALGVPFKAVSIAFDERFDLNDVKMDDVPEYLACQKAEAASHLLTSDNILITSDTLVLLGDSIMGKPIDKQDAFDMLCQLSGRSSMVTTGVCICSQSKKISFSSNTQIEFSSMSNHEIQYYIDQYNPLDKAGAYGIQEWIGMAFIRKISGCYNNVVGLPTELVYRNLKSFIGIETTE